MAVGRRRAVTGVESHRVGGWVIVLLAAELSALEAFHEAACSSTTAVCDMGTELERYEDSKVELDICEWEAAVVRRFGEA